MANEKTVGISTTNQATLSLSIDGAKVEILFPRTDLEGYRKAVEAFRNFDAIKAKLEQNAEDETASDSIRGANALELISDMIEEFQGVVKFAIGEEEWDEHFRKIARLVSLDAWEALAVQIISAYTEYVRLATSTEGKL